MNRILIGGPTMSSNGLLREPSFGNLDLNIFPKLRFCIMVVETQPHSEI